MISPLKQRVEKHVLDELDVAVTFHETLLLRFRAEIEFIRKQPPSENAPISEGWLNSLWRSEPAPTRDSSNLLLGYAQLFGYVRINESPGNIGSGDVNDNLFWNNPDYLNEYSHADSDLVETIQKSAFIRDHGASGKHKLTGITDFAAENYDPVAQNLVHDVLLPFSSLPTTPYEKLNLHQTTTLHDELALSVVPFYVTAQRLLFLHLDPKPVHNFSIEVPKPSDDLPPSYNTRLAAATGHGGAVSLVYLFIVGFSEEHNGQMTRRAVYFPIEYTKSSSESIEHDYLGKAILDNDWDVSETTTQISKIKASNGDQSHRDQFIEDLDTLIENSIQTVGMHARRRSSISMHGRSFSNLGAHKIKVSYQIRVNSQLLCTLYLLKPFQRPGQNIEFFLKVHEDENVSSRIVGYTCHLEAHESFLKSQRNIYKVTPTLKENVYAVALGGKPATISGTLYVPRHVSQEFVASSLMTLKYHLAFKFVLGEFDGTSPNENDEDYEVRMREYQGELDATEFKCSIPMTVV